MLWPSLNETKGSTRRSRRVNFPLFLLSLAWIGTDASAFCIRHAPLGFSMCKSILSQKKARWKQMWLSPARISSVSGGCGLLCKVILLERAFKYERIQLGGEMKLKLWPVIKSHQTLPFEKQGTSIWVRDARLLCSPTEAAFVIQSCRTHSSMWGFLENTLNKDWKQLVSTIKNEHHLEKCVISTAGTGRGHFILAFVPLLQLDLIMAVFQENVWWLFRYSSCRVCSCTQ